MSEYLKKGDCTMTNEQLAHDLAVAHVAGKQLPPDILVDEYQKNYAVILEYLRSQPKPKVKIHSKNDIGL